MSQQYNLCQKCGSSRLSAWSLLKEKSLENPLSAVANLVFQGGKHFLLGELSVRAKVYDKRSRELKRCENCQACYLECPVCGQLIPVDMSALILDKTTVQCSNCRKIILFASSESYNMEGG